MQIGSDKLLVNTDVHMQYGLTTDELEALIDKIKKNPRKSIFNSICASGTQNAGVMPALLNLSYYGYDLRRNAYSSIYSRCFSSGLR